MHSPFSTNIKVISYLLDASHQRKFQNSVEQLVACILISEAVFFIWEERNRRVHNEGEVGWLQIWRKIKAQAAHQMGAKLMVVGDDKAMEKSVAVKSSCLKESLHHDRERFRRRLNSPKHYFLPNGDLWCQDSDIWLF